MSGKEYTARTIEEALEKALNEMMLTRDDIDYEVVTHPSKGFLGFGQKDAVVRVRKKVTEELEDIIACIKEEREEDQEFVSTLKKETIATSKENVKETYQVGEQTKEAQKEESTRSQQNEKLAAESQTVRSTAAQPEVLEKNDKKKEEKAELAPEEATQKAAEKKAALDRASEKGKEFLSKIFVEMKLQVSIETQEKNGYLLFDLKGENLGILIGRRGDTLDALQFLLNLVINEKDMPKVKGIIDVENYRAKREETLIGLSRKLAAKAKKTGQKVVLEPMNPQERRIIHMALQNDHRVTTYSEGEEPYRKVVIVPEPGAKNHGRKESR